MSCREKGKISIKTALQQRDAALYHRLENIWIAIAREIQERQQSKEGHQQGPLHCGMVEDNLGKVIPDEQLINAGIDELRKKSDISKVVKECLYWYGLGLDEKYPSARLLNFVTVLESTLKKEGENGELKRAVSERGAILLYEKFEDRKKAFKELKEIYDIRSQVVHTGKLIDEIKLGKIKMQIVAPA